MNPYAGCTDKQLDKLHICPDMASSIREDKNRVTHKFLYTYAELHMSPCHIWNHMCAVAYCRLDRAAYMFKLMRTHMELSSRQWAQPHMSLCCIWIHKSIFLELIVELSVPTCRVVESSHVLCFLRTILCLLGYLAPLVWHGTASVPRKWIFQYLILYFRK